MISNTATASDITPTECASITEVHGGYNASSAPPANPPVITSDPAGRKHSSREHSG